MTELDNVEAGPSIMTGMWGAVRSRWPLVMAVPAVLVALTLVYQAVDTPQFTARAVVTAQVQSNNLSNQLGRLGGVAALAGASLGKSKDVTEFDKFQFLLKSDLLGDYEAHRGMLPIIFRDRWNSEKRTWRRPETTGQAIKDLLLPIFRLAPWSPPDGRDLAALYGRQLVQREVGETGMIELAYDDSDPARAVFVLQTMVKDANDILRTAATARAAQKAIYLRQQLALAQVAEYRSNLASLLGTEEQTLMLSSTKLPYAADIVQPFTVSAQPTSQRPLLFAMIAGVVGISLGVFVALVLGPRRLGPIA